MQFGKYPGFNYQYQNNLEFIYSIHEYNIEVGFADKKIIIHPEKKIIKLALHR